MGLGIQVILVLCEGNHCRSPMAEALLRDALDPAVSVRSAGLRAMTGHPPHPEAQRLLAKAGIDISGYRGRQLTAEMALQADLILVMDEAQRSACERLAPSARGRVFLLGHWLPKADQQIMDPIRFGPEAHRQAYHHLQRALQPWLLRLPTRNP